MSADNYGRIMREAEAETSEWALADEFERDEQERAARRVAAWFHAHQPSPEVTRYAWEWKALYNANRTDPKAMVKP